jgi:hypothetical protein
MPILSEIIAAALYLARWFATLEDSETETTPGTIAQRYSGVISELSYYEIGVIV